jgi:hypothetical protein
VAQVRTSRTKGTSPSLRAILIACTFLFVLAWQATPATAATVVSCPFDGNAGDALFRGFYVTNYPGTNLDQVTLAYRPDTAGTYAITLIARTGTYDGPIIKTSTIDASLPSTSSNTPVNFAFGGAAVAQGSTITFSQSATGPGSLLFDVGTGPCPGVTETEGTTPPLDFVHRDSVGLNITQAPPASPSNAFAFGELKLNKNQGTATLAVDVPGPGTLVLTGKGLVKQRPGGASRTVRVAAKAVSAAGKVKLKVKSKGKKKRKLNRTGTVKVKAKVTYTPTGGTANSKAKRIKLVKAR